MKDFTRFILVTASLLLATGCSSFNKDWRAAAAANPQPTGLAGAWEGDWVSDFNGHKGALRCIMTKIDDYTYDARFRAKYKKILSFEYTVPLKVTREGNNYRFEGQADLGKVAGGLYTYKGAATSATFFSTYDSKYDHGKFNMERATPE